MLLRVLFKKSSPFGVYSLSFGDTLFRKCTTSLHSHIRVENSDLKSKMDSSAETDNTTPPPSEGPPQDLSKYRLPSNVVPTTYDLYFYPNLDDGLFKGRVVTSATVLESVGHIVMHSKALNITSVTIDDDEGAFEVDDKYELLTVMKAGHTQIPAQSDIRISIDFEGDMKNRIVGLYTSSYLNEDGVRSYIATSKFEPTYARQAFPSFDEPNMKATYKVHLLKPNNPNYIALSNHPEIGTEPAEGGIMVHFQESVKMSTYLSCFIVSDFVSHPAVNFTNLDGPEVPFKVYASPGQLEKTTYAAEVGKKVIEFYIQYFNLPYPLPKLDMVAIPDFVSGAMEHWGLVTFRETALLYTDTTHSASNKQRVAEVIAHELAHSWFGNLVTMNWWNDLWLNEGFASYIQYKGTLAAEESWGMLDQFLIGDLHSVLSLDATQGSHPIIQTVTTPDQITEVFDTISYNKGASILRMLESVVGEQQFKAGVTNYLRNNEFGNAVTQDLWNEIQGVVGEQLNVTEFMNTFTVQMGYPVLTVEDTGSSYKLTQKRFLRDPETAGQGPASPLGYTWDVPVTYRTDSGDISDIFWFKHTDSELIVPKPAGAQWLKFNPEQIGYYRVNYDVNNWNALAENFKSFSVSDRTHLLEESFSLAAAGELSHDVPLSITKKLVEEFDYVPWSVASSKLQGIAQNLQTSLRLSEFQTYVQGLVKPAYDNYTWNESITDTHLARLARVTVLTLACAVDYEPALVEADRRFNDWISSPEEAIPPNLRTLIYKYGLVNANEATWNNVFENFFAKESDANEKLKLMNGLANVKNPTLLTRFIELAKDETYVRSQDYFTLLQYIASNPIGAPIVWDYVREHWKELVERFTLNDRYLGRLIPSITSRFSTGTKLEEMTVFFANNSDAGAGAGARIQALETVTNNIKWLQNFQQTVENWIANNK